MSKLTLPKNTELFIDTVNSDSQHLIECGFWNVRKTNFESWIKQFCSLEERFFAACLLDQLIFRTSQQFEASLRSLYRSNLYGKLFPEQQDLYLLQIVTEKKDTGLRLVPVICDTDPPTKSGPLVMRRLQRILKINQEWMCWPWQAADLIKNGTNTEIIIFVDDFLGTGKQFNEFFDHWEFPKDSGRIKYFYAPVVAHQKGIEYLTANLPFIQTVSAERLTDDHSFFSSFVWKRLGQDNISADEAKSWYLKFASDRIINPTNIGYLGYGDLALTFGFSHASPNNTLPVLWYETNEWKPLLER